MKTINYAMTADYRKEWGAIEAVRELVQNCLDNNISRQSSHYKIHDHGISISTDEYVLPMQVFALGATTKTEKDIGGFGEGMKLAMMILARLNLKPKIDFGFTTAIPVFEYDEVLGCDVFKINFEEHDVHYSGTIFYFDFPKDQIELLKKRVTVFNDNPLPRPLEIDLLKDRPGEVFVNGLYVCEDTKFRYGYNYAPHMIQLGCDRQIASTFGMAWETSRYWGQNITARNAAEVLSMMTENVMDVSDIHHFISEGNAKLITKAFNERFGDVTIKPMGSSLGYGMTVGGSLYSTIEKSGYINIANKWAETNTPYTKLEDFFKAEKKHMRRHAIRAFEHVLETSKGWKK